MGVVVGFGFGFGFGLDGVVVVFAGVVAGAVVAWPDPPEAGARLPAEGSASAPGVNDRVAMELAARPTATATSKPARRVRRL